MSAFNTLSSKIQCPNCRKIYEGQIQFKFGDTWQFQYQIGDKIKWGGNDIGKSGISKVKVYGILESSQCPICENLNVLNEFDINIENDIIIGVNTVYNIEDYFIEEGNYRICIE